MNNPPQIKTLLLISALALFAAIIPIWPYGLYVLLRFLICGVAIYGVYDSRQNKPLGRHKIPLIALAVLFNPLVPIHFDRSIWASIDLMAGIYLIVLSRTLKTKNS
jgi:hypothetical protein